jgi:ABC-type phosphate transport system substrate-binding protein
VWTKKATDGNSYGGSLVWPDDSATMISVAGSGGMTTALETTPYSIGYLDSGHGHSAAVREASVKNAAGEWVTANALGDAGIANAAVQYGGTYPDSHDNTWSGVSLVNQAGATTWPIVAFSYFIVREDLSALGEKGAFSPSATIDRSAPRSVQLLTAD